MLATASASGRPHASLMAYAADADGSRLFAATRRGTIKHRNMVENPRVSFLADRQTAGRTRELGGVEALTLVGTARLLTGDDETRQAKLRLTERHPDLTEFLNDPEVVIAEIMIESYLLAEGPGRVHYISKSDGI